MPKSKDVIAEQEEKPTTENNQELKSTDLAFLLQNLAADDS